MESFDGFKLKNPLRNAISDLGFEKPTPVQCAAFSVVRSGKDVVGIAQTGTGKTLAYLLPLLSQLEFSTQRAPRILIITPTRELVMQVVDELEKMTAYMSVRVAGVYGGANINTQSKMVYQGLDILVATPGRLYDLAMKGTLRLNSIKKLVIDEVDEMLNLGFRPQIINILDLLPAKRQNLMFSASLSDDVEGIIKDFFISPYWIDLYDKGTPLEKIRQYLYILPNWSTKYNLLTYLLKQEEVFARVLVFAQNKKLSDKLFDQLEKEFPGKCGVIHSNKSQNYRFRMLDEFKTGALRIMISTDLVARGVDIYEVSHVINYGLPALDINFLHRIGRTGRADKNGVAITMITESEQQHIKRIQESYHFKISELSLPEDIKMNDTEDQDYLIPLAGDKPYLISNPIREKESKSLKTTNNKSTFRKGKISKNKKGKNKRRK